MKINKEYRMVLKAGKRLDKQLYKAEQESGVIVSIVTVVSMTAIIVLLMIG